MAKNKLTATRLDHYVSKKGNVTFRYLVNGEEADLKAYEEAQGVNYRAYENKDDAEDKLNGRPLWFTTQALPKEVKLTITTNNKVIFDQDTDAVAEKVLMEEELITMELAKLKANQRFNRNRVTGQ